MNYSNSSSSIWWKGEKVIVIIGETFVRSAEWEIFKVVDFIGKLIFGIIEEIFFAFILILDLFIPNVLQH